MELSPARGKKISIAKYREEHEEKLLALLIMTSDVETEFAQNYQMILEANVFSLNDHEHTKNTEGMTSYRKLKSEASKVFLSLVWKNSPYIPEKSLEITGVTRIPRDEMSISSVARMLTDVPSNKDLSQTKYATRLDAMRTEVTRMVKAAKYFDLVKIHKKGEGSFILGTEKLNEFMKELQLKNSRILNRLDDRTQELQS